MSFGKGREISEAEENDENFAGSYLSSPLHRL